jgi:hypothetical protein
VHSFKRRQHVTVPIAFEERALRSAAKKNDAMWSAAHKVWVMTYSAAVALGIKNGIIEGLAEKCDDVDLYVE